MEIRRAPERYALPEAGIENGVRTGKATPIVEVREAVSADKKLELYVLVMVFAVLGFMVYGALAVLPN